jgi:hypothetical protein
MVCVACWRLQEYDVEFGRQAREHVDGPYNVLHKRDAVASVVILVAADAFDEHLDVRARNHHLLHLG